jgi:hypothetical protein
MSDNKDVERYIIFYTMWAPLFQKIWKIMLKYLQLQNENKTPITYKKINVTHKIRTESFTCFAIMHQLILQAISFYK